MNAFAKKSSGWTSSPKASPVAVPSKSPARVGLGIHQRPAVPACIGRRISKSLPALNPVQRGPESAADYGRGPGSAAAPKNNGPAVRQARARQTKPIVNLFEE